LLGQNLSLWLLHCLIVLSFAGPFANQLRTATTSLLMSVRTSVCMYHSDLQATDIRELSYWIFWLNCIYPLRFWLRSNNIYRHSTWSTYLFEPAFTGFHLMKHSVFLWGGLQTEVAETVNYRACSKFRRVRDADFSSAAHVISMVITNLLLRWKYFSLYQITQSFFSGKVRSNNRAFVPEVLRSVDIFWLVSSGSVEFKVLIYYSRNHADDHM